MTDLNAEIFNFETLGGDNPFGEQKQSYGDNRFYKLPKNQDGVGAAIIRFLPDPKMKLIQQLFKINVNTQSPKNGERRWYSDWSPQNVNLPDPFHDEWKKRWNAGDKEGAKQFSRQTRYIANILVVKDPAAPENEGKVFLLEMSQSLKDIVADALMPSKADQALGKEPVQLFNPLAGSNFKLASKKGSNGFITYEQSGPTNDASAPTAVFNSKEEALATIQEKCYELGDFLKPENYTSLAELKEKVKYVLFQDAEDAEDKSEVQDISNIDTGLGNAPANPVMQEAPAAQTVQVAQVQEKPIITAPKSTGEDLDEFLDSIMQ